MGADRTGTGLRIVKHGVDHTIRQIDILEAGGKVEQIALIGNALIV